MSIVQVIIDETASRTLTGTITFDRSQGGTLVFPSGSSFPLTPTAGEWFWRTDLNQLYRRNDANTAWNIISGTSSASAKSGFVIPGSFSGNPKKATITFASAYPDTNYAITLAPVTDGTKTFVTSIESKTVSGFVLNLNSNNVANLIEIGWHTMVIGS